MTKSIPPSSFNSLENSIGRLSGPGAFLLFTLFIALLDSPNVIMSVLFSLSNVYFQCSGGPFLFIAYFGVFTSHFRFTFSFL